MEIERVRIEETPEVLLLIQMLHAWKLFIFKGKNTEFMTKEEFVYYIDKEREIIEFDLIDNDGELWLFKRNSLCEEDQHFMSEYQKIITRLKEIYEERFKEKAIENEKYLFMNQKVLLMNSFGFLETKEFNDLTQTGKQILISKILDCDLRTARALLNGEGKYATTPENKDEVQKIIKRISPKNQK